jgi:hypothetical protein
MIEEDEATTEVKEIYSDIKSTLGIDFVPNMYKLMAPKPAYLEAMSAVSSGRLDAQRHSARSAASSASSLTERRFPVFVALTSPKATAPSTRIVRSPMSPHRSASAGCDRRPPLAVQTKSNVHGPLLCVAAIGRC